LRTPIALLRTEIEVALYRPRRAEEYRATLGLLLEQTERMTSLVENLLSLARADGGAETVTIAPIRVGPFLHGLAETWKSMMNQAMLDFSVEITDEKLVVLGNEDSIQRLFTILLENAGKFSPPGGSVKVRTTVEESRVRFSVQDTGFGISPEHKLRIFDRFFRVAPNGGSADRGSGLGLALAKWIAERHGTELSVESELGTGSSFSFCLQRADHALPAKDALSTFNDDSRRTVNTPS
jgi:signal transduction histidine kinase